MTEKTMTANSQLESLLEERTVKRYRVVTQRDGRYAGINTRVSSQEQADNNGSLEVKKKYCEEYAQRQGITVKESFGGKYESAETGGRKEFQRMLSFIRKTKDVVLYFPDKL